MFCLLTAAGEPAAVSLRAGFESQNYLLGLNFMATWRPREARGKKQAWNQFAKTGRGKRKQEIRPASTREYSGFERRKQEVGLHEMKSRK